jgi:hypothetical protein
MSPQIKKRNDCRACGRRDLELYLSLKPTPIGDAFLAPEKKNQKQKIFPIDLYLCNSCGLAQLINVIRSDVLCGDYIEIDPKSLKLTDHFQKYANDLISSGQFQSNDLVVNICTEKQLTNMRASGTDDKMRIVPKINFSLEEAMEYIQGDEYVEITPTFIRLRKIYLDENERKRFGKQLVS